METVVSGMWRLSQDAHVPKQMLILRKAATHGSTLQFREGMTDPSKAVTHRVGCRRRSQTQPSLTWSTRRQRIRIDCRQLDNAMGIDLRNWLIGLVPRRMTERAAKPGDASLAKALKSRGYDSS
jgi:hypothetical protein